MKLLLLLNACTALTIAKIYGNKFPYYPSKLSINRYIDVSPRIINGTEVKPHSIPSQAWIDIKGTFNSTWQCGGVLISNNYVLTAAHCGEDAISATVLLGAHDITRRESTQVKIESKSIKVHELWGNFKNDLSLIKLRTPVTFNDNIQAVKLPSRNDATKTYVGQLAKDSGWGLTNGKVDKLSPVLIAEESYILENSECQTGLLEAGLDSIIIGNESICTSGADAKSSCNGDSGGPLTAVDDGTLIGLVSWGIKECPSGVPSVFARVPNFLDWIEKNSDVTFV